MLRATETERHRKYEVRDATGRIVLTVVREGDGGDWVARNMDGSIVARDQFRYTVFHRIKAEAH